MKKTAKILLCMLIVLMAVSQVPFSYASASDVVVSFTIDNTEMYVNGVKNDIDAGRDTKPLIIDGRTLVPIRAVIEAFGGKVSWDDASKTAMLSMDDDVIALTVGSPYAKLNGKTHTLDVSPRIINGRTMLPIRFVAEGFNLAVAWDDSTKTVYVIQNTFDDNDYKTLMEMLPDYSGKPYATINRNKPFFKSYEIIDASFEFYGELDEFGRCDVAFSSRARDIMPTEKRGSISSVTPTGWINKSYDVVNGGYLYNRCHLIGYQLTGENANKRNLITGTRYLNTEGMLPFENEIADYIKETGGRVIYRSSPVFSGKNLVADGVLIEAYSVEDKGESVSFCVYCYNVQPQITIDYTTGNSWLVGSAADSPPNQNTNGPSDCVYITPAGKKYHLDADCGGINSFEVSTEQALAKGLTPCKKCAQ